MKIGVKIYALVANYYEGLSIIEVSDPLNPVLFGNISTGGSAIGVRMIEIGVKIYTLVLNGDDLKMIQIKLSNK